MIESTLNDRCVVISGMCILFSKKKRVDHIDSKFFKV